jgi:hypothetical protein
VRAKRQRADQAHDHMPIFFFRQCVQDARAFCVEVFLYLAVFTHKMLSSFSLP